MKATSEVLALEKLQFLRAEYQFLFHFLGLINIFASLNSLALVLSISKLTRLIFVLNLAILITMTILYRDTVPLMVILFCWMIGEDQECCVNK